MGTLATTRQGQVEGREKDGVLLFAGLPYAAPPTGPRRFRPPEPPEPWTGVRDATRFGAIAPQVPGMLGGLVAHPDTHQSEDCLVLNVQTPGLDGRRPVMVWIHGGGFTGGTGATPWYNGAGFARRGDVVVVTINYRLGALGFLHLGELAGDTYRSSGLNGILDQVAALEWVRDNIEAFGGDPGNVTIFGESAGGMSVATLLGLPRAAGLFHRAIAQSGAAHNLIDPAHAAEVARTFVEAGGFDDVDSLFTAEPAALLAAQGQVAAQLLRRRVREHVAAPSAADGSSSGAALAMPFQPVLDGVELPRPPIEAIRAGAAAGIPLLTGTTAEEWNLFHVMSPGGLDDTRLLRRLDRLYPRGAEIGRAYAEAFPDAGPDERWCAVLTDAVFRLPAIRLAEAQAPHAPGNTFMYLFSWRSAALDGRLGACHALEIPFVFETLGAPGAAMFLGADPGPTEDALARAMHDAWWHFARTGDPGHDGLEPWPAYEPTGDRATMEFGPTTALVTDPHSRERAVWDGIL